MCTFHYRYAVVALALLAFASAALGCKRSYEPAFVEESAEVRKSSYTEVFGGPREPSATVASVDAFLSTLNAAFHRGDLAAAASLFDVRAFHHVVGLQHPLPADLRCTNDACAQAFLGTIIRSDLPWATHEVFRVVAIPNTSEVIAFSKHRYGDGRVRPMRWWLVGKDGDAWTTYDFEHCDVGVRFTTLFGLTTAPTDSRLTVDPRRFDEEMKKVKATTAAFSRGDYDAMEAIANDLDATVLPAALRVLYHSVLAKSALDTGHADRAAEWIALIELSGIFLPSAPLLHARLALALADSGYDPKSRAREALESLERYIAMFGDDESVAVFRASALLHLERREEAARTLIAALAQNPNCLECVAWLGAEGLTSDDRVVEYFQSMVVRDDDVRWLVREVGVTGKLDLARRLVDVFAKRRPASPLVEEMRRSDFFE